MQFFIQLTHTHVIVIRISERLFIHHVDSSIICKNQKVELTECSSIEEWINKSWYYSPLRRRLDVYFADGDADISYWSAWFKS